MIEHTKEQIKQVKGYFERESYRLIKGTVAGRRLEYFLLPSSLNKELPNFIYRSTNSSLEDYVLGICETVPQEIQPYFALAEYIEFKEKGLSICNRVMNAEKEVLGIIPEILKKDYIKLKLELFKRELELDLFSPESYQLEEEGRKEFFKAVKFLEKELEQYLLK